VVGAVKHEAAEFKEISAMERSSVAHSEERRKKLDRSCLPFDRFDTYQVGGVPIMIAPVGSLRTISDGSFEGACITHKVHKSIVFLDHQTQHPLYEILPDRNLRQPRPKARHNVRG